MGEKTGSNGEHTVANARLSAETFRVALSLGLLPLKRQREVASAAGRRGRPREPACPLLPCQPWPPWPLPPRTLATPRAGVPAARAEPFRRPGGTRGQRPSSGSQRCLGLVWLAGGTGGGLPAAPATSPAESAHPNRASVASVRGLVGRVKKPGKVAAPCTVVSLKKTVISKWMPSHS